MRKSLKRKSNQPNVKNAAVKSLSLSQEDLKNADYIICHVERDLILTSGDLTANADTTTKTMIQIILTVVHEVVMALKATSGV